MVLTPAQIEPKSFESRWIIVQELFESGGGRPGLSVLTSLLVGAQTVVRLLQTTHILSDVYFITDHVAYASSNKTRIV